MRPIGQKTFVAVKNFFQLNAGNLNQAHGQGKLFLLEWRSIGELTDAPQWLHDRHAITPPSQFRHTPLDPLVKGLQIGEH